MADSEIAQQVTSQTPTTKQKDPKKVAAGQALQQKNREAREAQKKKFEDQKRALDEANMKIAEFERKNDETPVSEPESTKNLLTSTQWLSVIGIIVSLAGIYYKREEIKRRLTEVLPLTRAPPPSPVLPPARRLRKMD